MRNKLKFLQKFIVLPPDTKLICSGGDFVSWNFYIMG